MTIVVEDGTGKSSANSYMDAEDIRSYAAARGIALPGLPDDEEEDDPIQGAMILAMDYLESLMYEGYRATEVQALAYPRKFYMTTDPSKFLMPTKIQSAQAQLVIEQMINGIDLFASSQGFNQGGGFVLREKVDVIETQYSDKVINGSAQMPAVDALLRGLTVGGSGLRTVRV